MQGPNSYNPDRRDFSKFEFQSELFLRKEQPRNSNNRKQERIPAYVCEIQRQHHIEPNASPHQ